MTNTIRLLRETDNKGLAEIIRAALDEFGIPKIGTVYSDPTTDDLYALFKQNGSCYFVAGDNKALLGGCGIYPTPGLPDGCAELVKLYLRSEARGQGTGKQLLDTCIKTARSMGYKQLYIESFPELNNAVGLYLKAGFYYLDHPLGNSGHHACTIWMLKDL